MATKITGTLEVSFHIPFEFTDQGTAQDVLAEFEALMDTDKVAMILELDSDDRLKIEQANTSFEKVTVLNHMAAFLYDDEDSELGTTEDDGYGD